MESDEALRKAIRELYFYRNGTASGFNEQLFDLIKKADLNNKEKIRKGFPSEVAAIDLWNISGNYGDDLFKEYGLLK